MRQARRGREREPLSERRGGERRVSVSGLKGATNLEGEESRVTLGWLIQRPERCRVVKVRCGVRSRSQGATTLPS